VGRERVGNEIDLTASYLLPLYFFPVFHWEDTKTTLRALKHCSKFSKSGGISPSGNIQDLA